MENHDDEDPLELMETTKKKRTDLLTSYEEEMPKEEAK